MRIHRRVLIERPPEEVFELVSDPAGYPAFFSGISRWEPRSRKRRGTGARFRVLMRVGSIEAGGTVRITEWRAPERIAWEAESGVEQRGAWEIRPAQAGSELHLEIDFSLPGGAIGWVVERVAGRLVDRNVLATLLAARRILEHEREKPRARAKAGGATGRTRAASRSAGA